MKRTMIVVSIAVIALTCPPPLAASPDEIAPGLQPLSFIVGRWEGEPVTEPKDYEVRWTVRTTLGGKFLEVDGTLVRGAGDADGVTQPERFRAFIGVAAEKRGLRVLRVHQFKDTGDVLVFSGLDPGDGHKWQMFLQSESAVEVRLTLLRESDDQFRLVVEQRHGGLVERPAWVVVSRTNFERAPSR